MDNVSRMHVVAASQHLEQKVLQMIVCKVLSGVNDAVHISFHKLCNDVDILEAGLSWWFGYIKYLDNVLMVKEFEQSNFSHNSLRIDQVFESIGYLLNSDFLLRSMVICAANYTICTVTDLLDVFILIFDPECSTYSNIIIK